MSPTTPTTLVIEAPAKINLYLRVLRRRPDGYHDLETVMQKLELADRLELKVIENGVRLACPGAEHLRNDENLAFRAAAAFLRATGVRQGVEIVLHKQIPVAAGLGGGSSDAAAVLVGLHRLFAPAGVDEAFLLRLAVRLGADVPFFVAREVAARATGIGDLLQPAPSLRGCRVLLVNPGFPVSTRWVYENLALTTKTNPYILGRDQIQDNYRGLLATSQPLTASNDLERVTIGKFPELGEIKREMVAAGADLALMSGSGPTVFGLFSEEGPAADCHEYFLRRYPQNVFLTSPRRML